MLTGTYSRNTSNSKTFQRNPKRLQKNAFGPAMGGMREEEARQMRDMEVWGGLDASTGHFCKDRRLLRHLSDRTLPPLA